MLVALKLQLAAAALAGALGPLAVTALLPGDASSPDHGVAVVRLPPATFLYRESGAFTRDGRIAAAPLRPVRVERPLTIMRHQVTQDDYDRCVAAGACKAPPADVGHAPLTPAVQISFRDAEAYARWLSRRTGHRYRLPTDAEWAYAAGARFHDDAAPVDPADPSRTWLAQYAREAAAAERGLDATPRPVGSFGVNDKGLVDVAGNVWEWTSTCFSRRALQPGGATTTNCRVRIVEGGHRTAMPDFIRDAKAGGCAVGTPPSNLGFRLVREDPPPGWRQRLDQGVARLAAALSSRH